MMAKGNSGMIEMACPHCGKKLNIPDQYAGQSGECNNHGGTLIMALHTWSSGTAKAKENEGGFLRAHLTWRQCLVVLVAGPLCLCSFIVFLASLAGGISGLAAGSLVPAVYQLAVAVCSLAVGLVSVYSIVSVDKQARQRLRVAKASFFYHSVPGVSDYFDSPEELLDQQKVYAVLTLLEA